MRLTLQIPPFRDSPFELSQLNHILPLAGRNRNETDILPDRVEAFCLHNYNKRETSERGYFCVSLS